MKNDVTFGQYYPVKSFVHNMDPRAKIILLIAYIVLIFVIKNFWGFLVAGGFLIISVLFSKVPIRSVLRSLKAVIFIVIITSLINLFLHREEGAKVIFSWWIFTITDLSARFALFMMLRILFLVFGSSILTLTTTPIALTDGIESLMTPLKYLKVPVHEIALIMSIALRFIPTLSEETNRIISAQKSRGADFDNGSFFKRIKALIPVLIPLIFSSFRRADELGDAMDARCYSASKKRTRYKKLKLSYRDFVAFLFVAAMFTGVIFLNLSGVSVI